MKKKRVLYMAVPLGAAALVILVNLLTLEMPVSGALGEDSRNEVVEVDVHYGYYVHPGILIIDLEDVEGASRADVFRVLLQTADALQTRSFSQVELHRNGEHRFTVPGSYFKEVGEEYSFQNPVYTMRTFTEQVKDPDGTRAFYSFGGGGLLGGLASEMETFNEFISEWAAD